jgi:hypothetical protein
MNADGIDDVAFVQMSGIQGEMILGSHGTWLSLGSEDGLTTPVRAFDSANFHQVTLLSSEDFDGNGRSELVLVGFNQGGINEIFVSALCPSSDRSFYAFDEVLPSTCDLGIGHHSDVHGRTAVRIDGERRVPGFVDANDDGRLEMVTGNIAYALPLRAGEELTELGHYSTPENLIATQGRHEPLRFQDFTGDGLPDWFVEFNPEERTVVIDATIGWDDEIPIGPADSIRTVIALDDWATRTSSCRTVFGECYGKVFVREGAAAFDCAPGDEADPRPGPDSTNLTPEVLDPAPDARVTCAGVECDADEVCCSDGVNDAQCAVECDSYPVHCDSTAGCPEGAVCCRSHDDGVTACRTSCFNGEVVCRTDADCSIVTEFYNYCQPRAGYGVCAPSLPVLKMVECGGEICTDGLACCSSGGCAERCPADDVSYYCDGAEDCPAGMGCVTCDRLRSGAPDDTVDCAVTRWNCENLVLGVCRGADDCMSCEGGAGFEPGVCGS